jgi:Domain of unknown function (DUF4386)
LVFAEKGAGMLTTGKASKQTESKINTNRKTAIIAGTLFIVATTASLLGNGLTGAMLASPDYLSIVSSNGNRVIAGALLSFLAAAASSGIALSLYPVLKKHSEGLAIGAVGFRLIEGVFYMVGALCLLALLPVSHQFVSAGTQDASTLQTIGHLLLAVNDLAGFVLGVFAFCLGGTMYYFVFYQSRLIPRWLSLWGIVALVLLLVAAFLTLFDGEPYSVSGNLIFLALPIFLQEMVLAVWLIIKGFNTSAPTSESVKPVRTFA